MFKKFKDQFSIPFVLAVAVVAIGAVMLYNNFLRAKSPVALPSA